MRENIIKAKTYQLSVEVVLTYKKLKSTHKEPDLFKQLLRSGTSIAANVREAMSAESDKDFIHKLSISRKETNETIFWLDLLKDTFYIDEVLYRKLVDQAKQVLKILTCIILTTKKKLNLL